MENFYREVMHIHDEAFIARLCEISSTIDLKKDGVLLKVGDVPSRLCLLESGGLRGYYLNAQKQEVTDCFCSTPGDALMPSFELDKPSHLTIAAYKNSRVVCLPLPESLSLIGSHPEGRACYELLVRQAAVRQQFMKMQFHKPAAERYEWFLKAYPTEASEVSGRCIASFLGMTPVTLSRLRHPRGETAVPEPPAPETAAEPEET